MRNSKNYFRFDSPTSAYRPWLVLVTSTRLQYSFSRGILIVQYTEKYIDSVSTYYSPIHPQSTSYKHFPAG